MGVEIIESTGETMFTHLYKHFQQLPDLTTELFSEVVRWIESSFKTYFWYNRASTSDNTCHVNKVIEMGCNWSTINGGSCYLLSYLFAVIKVSSSTISLYQRRFKSQILHITVKLLIRFYTLMIKHFIKKKLLKCHKFWFAWTISEKEQCLK